MKYTLTMLLVLLLAINLNARDTLEYRLRFTAPVIDLPSNSSQPTILPSMNQALWWSDGLYELSFYGIEILGDKIFYSRTKPITNWRRISNFSFKYLTSLAFARYGSELPIPLGVWAHEEFHRSVMGVNDISSENGNWILNRWDGTVYGVSDQTLESLKSNHPDRLLYSYVSGVQYEVLLNEKKTLDNFYKFRSFPKAALLLYNAYYVYNYFNFSTSAASDSVKILAPPNESVDPMERDFAGADLTAWVYDMFYPDLPYTSRDSFPNGEGVNRRIGFSDLPSDGQDFLLRQKRLSLLNFINPGIFFINRIRINDDFLFTFFTQYAPTHFGNATGLFLPVQYKKYDLLLGLHQFKNQSAAAYGFALGLYNYPLSPRFEAGMILNMWQQPASFFSDEKINGGDLKLNIKYNLDKHFSIFVEMEGKTEGWLLGNPYLDKNFSGMLGLSYQLAN